MGILLFLVLYAILGLTTLFVFTMLRVVHDWKLTNSENESLTVLVPIFWPVFWLAGVFYFVLSRVFQVATVVQQVGVALAVALKKKDQ